MAEPKYLIVSKLSQKDIDRIFSKISVDPVTGCWNWTGTLTRKGYGSVYYRGRHERIHRLLYAWMRHPIPMGVGRNIPVLDHVICSNPRCCNPAHLELRSQRENILRGSGACAANARKTLCPKGHPLPTEPDTGYGPGRRCSICLFEKRNSESHRRHKSEYDREYRKRKH